MALYDAGPSPYQDLARLIRELHAHGPFPRVQFTNEMFPDVLYVRPEWDDMLQTALPASDVVRRLREIYSAGETSASPVSQ